MHVVETTRFRRRKLPHWEIKNGRYFVTVRLADSLTDPVVARLHEIHRDLSAIEPASAQFAALPRQYFATMEKYLDAGTGPVCCASRSLRPFSPGNSPRCAIGPSRCRTIRLCRIIGTRGSLLRRIAPKRSTKS